MQRYLARTGWWLVLWGCLQGLGVGAGEHLNVVLIVADDLGWAEVGCYGQQKIPTPHIDQLAAEGMRFTQHYSGAPVCAPSRCVLLTGKHLGHAEIRGNRQARLSFPQFSEGQHPISENAVTIASRFRDAGYATGAIGKWGLGPVGSSGDPERHGFDYFFGYNCQAVAHSYYPSTLWHNHERVPLNARPVDAHPRELAGSDTAQMWVGEHYAPDRMIAEAERFVDMHAQGPFFLYLPFIEPHVAMHPPMERLSLFPAEWDSEPYRGRNGYLPHPRPRAAYAAMIHDLDRHVGRILKAIARNGLAQHTLVIFTSDNGPTHAGSGEPRFHVGGADPKFFDSTADLRGYKGSVYEGGIRVPLIVRLPGRIAAGQVCDFPSYFADWYPTLLDAMGFAATSDLDGLSLWPTLTGAARSTKRDTPMIWVFPEYQGQVAVRLGDMKVVRQRLATTTPGPWEVYDLVQDRAESHDLAATRPDVIRQAIRVLREEVADNSTFPLTIPEVDLVE